MEGSTLFCMCRKIEENVILSQVMKYMVIIFLLRMSVRVSVRRKTLNIISARGIIGVASHGNHTRAIQPEKKISRYRVKFEPQYCPESGYGNFIPQIFYLNGDPVYAYHDFATRKNDVHYLAHNRLNVVLLTKL